jgi:D-sedoheptulose 7-phosphate isomerase
MTTNNFLESLIERHPPLTTCRPAIDAGFKLMQGSFASGGKLLLCGNGGSAADCSHIAGELLKGFLSPRPLDQAARNLLGESLAGNLQGALPVIALPSFDGFLTAFANDCDPRYNFAQLVWGLGTRDDVLLAISTSGDSANILHAVEVAAAKGLKTIALTGETGGTIKDKVDVCIRAPAISVEAVQEYHLPIYHCLCLMLEDAFFQ